MFILWLCIVWLSLCLPMQAQEPSVPELTFQEALHQVLAQHPELAASRLKVEAARAWAGGAGAQPNPEMRVAARVGDVTGDENYLSQRLNIGGQTGLRSQIAEVAVKQAELEFTATARELATKTSEAYYGLWLAAKTTRVAIQRLELAEQLDKISFRRLELGDISRNEHLRVQLETGRVRADLAQARAQEVIARNRLNLLLQRPANTPLDLPALATEHQPEEPLDAYLARAAGRPEIAIARLQAETARLEADLADRQRWPDLELYAYSSSFSGAAQRGFRMGLVVPLWDWGQIGAEVARKEKEAEALEKLTEARRLLVEQEVRSAYEQHGAAIQRAQLLGEQAQQAQLLAENARKGYDAGFLTVLDVIDAQRAYRDSVKDFLQAQVDAQRTRLELFWISAGSLVSEEEKP